MKLTDNEISRYARQISLSGVGIEGQGKIKGTKVLVIGAGGLGVAASQYLAAAGIGTLIIADGDEISLSNLHRQPVYMEKDLGQNKAMVLSNRLRELNSDIDVITIPCFIDHTNAVDLFDRIDIVLDCTDNLKSRYLINDVCTIRNKPFISASIYKDEGQIGLFNYMGSGTFRCMYPEGESKGIIPSCQELGVLGILPGILGLMQANEVLKIALNRGDLLTNKILYTSILNNTTLSVKYDRNEVLTKALIKKGSVSDPMPNITLNKEDLAKITPEEWSWIDVRETHETPVLNHKTIHQIPLHRIETASSLLDLSSGIICFCQSGMRSVIAAEILIKNGFKNVRAFTGNIAELRMKKFFRDIDITYEKEKKGLY